MYDPFNEQPEPFQEDLKWVWQTLEGNRNALEKLINRHQPWIYNIALRMISDPVDAEDITQEVLIKMMSNLATYDSQRGSFRTWLYRITANHIIDMQKKRREAIFSENLNIQNNFILPSEIPDQRSDSYPDHEILIKETKINCLNGLLLCLDRRKRLVFILGAIFDVPSSIGSEILEISQVNFRKILSRSRKMISDFLSQNCGHINQSNPCECSKQIGFQIKMGLLTPDYLLSNRSSSFKISGVIDQRIKDLESSYYDEYISLFRAQPFYDPPDLTVWLRKTLENDHFKDLLNLH